MPSEKTLDVARLNASVLSVILGALSAYGIFVLGESEVLEERALSISRTLNEDGLPFRYRFSPPGVPLFWESSGAPAACAYLTEPCGQAYVSPHDKARLFAALVRDEPGWASSELVRGAEISIPRLQGSARGALLLATMTAIAEQYPYRVEEDELKDLRLAEWLESIRKESEYMLKVLQGRQVLRETWAGRPESGSLIAEAFEGFDSYLRATEDYLECGKQQEDALRNIASNPRQSQDAARVSCEAGASDGLVVVSRPRVSPWSAAAHFQEFERFLRSQYRISSQSLDLLAKKESYLRRRILENEELRRLSGLTLSVFFCSVVIPMVIRRTPEIIAAWPPAVLYVYLAATAWLSA
ncbi:MAG: hypothetical protein NXI30_04050 [bacterium]|nr:hypothetical protein [bacterium]